MKKQLMLIVVIALTGTACFAQKEKAGIPEKVTTAFQKEFPGITPKWEKEKAQYEANFKKNNVEMSAVFDADGTLAETETIIATNELPSAALDYVKTHYKGATIKEAAKIADRKGVITYEAEVKGKDLMFDAEGKFFKAAKD